MTPVISPWLFYLMNIVDKLFIIEIIMIGVSLGFLVVNIILYYAEMDYMPDEKTVKRITKHIKAWGICASVMGLLLCVVPSGETITKTIIAQNVTYERVEAATDTVETVYNDIMALFEDKGETE